MFCLNQNLVKLILQMKDAKDLLDEFNDLRRINIAIDEIELFGILLNARTLDRELYAKYPIIDKMLKIANKLNPFSNTCSYYVSNEAYRILNNLKQDELGIYCHMILKKKLADCIEDIVIRPNDNI